jgi:hypothetical protein
MRPLLLEPVDAVIGGNDMDDAVRQMILESESITLARSLSE